MHRRDSRENGPPGSSSRPPGSPRPTGIPFRPPGSPRSRFGPPGSPSRLSVAPGNFLPLVPPGGGSFSSLHHRPPRPPRPPRTPGPPPPGAGPVQTGPVQVIQTAQGAIKIMPTTHGMIQVPYDQ